MTFLRWVFAIYSFIHTTWINISHHFNIPIFTFCVLLIKGIKDGGIKLPSEPTLIRTYCFIPILASLLSYISFIFKRQRKLSKLYDMDDNYVTLSRRLRPFLPEKEESAAWNKLYNELKSSQKRKVKNLPSCGWAMVTGASRGIGRAVSIELARYNIPVILVARDGDKLKEVAVILEECYGVATKLFISDFSKNNAAEELMDKVTAEGLQIDILVSNAGISDTKDMVNMDTSKIQDIINVNLVTGSKLSQMLGIKMKQRQSGRICIISSIAGAVPGKYII